MTVAVLAIFRFYHHKAPWLIMAMFVGRHVPTDIGPMHHKIPSYILTHRKRWALTQKELARLFGAKSETQVSRWERSIRKPTLHVVLASQVIFGETPEDMFPKLYSEVEERVMQQAHKLYTSLAGSTSKASKRKLELLDDVLRRAIGRSNDHEV